MGTNNEKLEAGSKPSGSVSLVIVVSRQRLTKFSERLDRGMSTPPLGEVFAEVSARLQVTAMDFTNNDESRKRFALWLPGAPQESNTLFVTSLP